MPLGLWKILREIQRKHFFFCCVYVASYFAWNWRLEFGNVCIFQVAAFNHASSAILLELCVTVGESLSPLWKNKKRNHNFVIALALNWMQPATLKSQSNAGWLLFIISFRELVQTVNCTLYVTLFNQLNSQGDRPINWWQTQPMVALIYLSTCLFLLQPLNYVTQF